MGEGGTIIVPEVKLGLFTTKKSPISVKTTCLKMPKIAF